MTDPRSAPPASASARSGSPRPGSVTGRPTIVDAPRPSTFEVDAVNERGETVPTAIAGEHPVAQPNMGMGAAVATVMFLILLVGVTAWLVSTQRRTTEL